jgi:hypothetical protein
MVLEKEIQVFVKNRLILMAGRLSWTLKPQGETIQYFFCFIMDPQTGIKLFVFKKCLFIFMAGMCFWLKSG